jgi:diguanylate cyclase (GGDEF)-like protein
MPRPERGDPPVRHRRGPGDHGQRYRLKLIVIWSIIGVAGATWLPGASATAANIAETGPSATPSSPITRSVMEIEARVASRLRDVAAARDTLDLADGIRGAAERATAAGVLAQVRGEDAALVRNACVMPLGARGRVSIDGGLGDPKWAGCVSLALREAIAATEPDVIMRDLKLGDSHPRLLLAAVLRDPQGAPAGVLSVDVDLQALLRLAAASRPAESGPLLVELDSGALLATTGSLATLPEIGVLIADREGGDAAGAAAAITSLWSLGDGREIGLVAPVTTPVTDPVTAPGPTSSSNDPRVSVAGALLLFLLLSIVALSLRHVTRRRGARTRVEALYRDATGPGEDGLTGLPDALAFGEAIEARMATYLSEGVPFALALVDLDDLRAVNDRDGQDAGDEAIVAAAETLDQLTRREDRVFRVGSDEFAVVLPGFDAAAGAEILERVLRAYRRPPSGLRPGSFSCGISAVPSYSTNGAVLQRQAQAALSWVKAHGRGSVEIYEPDRDHVPDQPHDIATHAVREVVAGKLLSPVFQPIVDLQSGRIIGFEGLIRPDPRGPLPDTSHLFAAASASGRTVELDLACIEVLLAGARAIGPDRLLTLNLSPRTLEVRDFDAAWLLDGLLRNGIAPSRVIIELTERDAVGDLRRLQRTINHLQSFGLRLAADDVGAGNSGLQLLSQVRFDIVKIDLTLVQQGVHDMGSRAVLESLRDLALSQHAHVVAEGVETAEQLHVLRDLDIGAAQGFLLGRPNRSVEATFVDVRGLASGLLVADGLTTSPPAASSEGEADAPVEGEVVAPVLLRPGLAWGPGSSSPVVARR